MPAQITVTPTSLCIHCVDTRWQSRMESEGEACVKGLFEDIKAVWVEINSEFLGRKRANRHAMVKPPMPPQHNSAKVGGLSLVHMQVPGEHSSSGK